MSRRRNPIACDLQIAQLPTKPDRPNDPAATASPISELAKPEPVNAAESWNTKP